MSRQSELNHKLSLACPLHVQAPLRSRAKTVVAVRRDHGAPVSLTPLERGFGFSAEGATKCSGPSPQGDSRGLSIDRRRRCASSPPAPASIC